MSPRELDDAKLLLADLNQHIGAVEQSVDPAVGSSPELRAAQSFFDTLLSERLIFRRASGKIDDKAGFIEGLSKDPFESRSSEQIAIELKGDCALLSSLSARCVRTSPFTASDYTRLEGRLAPALLELAAQDGWTSYNNRAVWLWDPDDWAGVATPWHDEGAAKADLVMRTAFGEMIVWDGTFFWLVMPHEAARMRLTEWDDWLLGSTLPLPDFYFRDELPRLVERATQQVGPVGPNTMFSYVPALALGGKPGTSRIETAGAREALALLAQLAPVTGL
jgi:hypothetical protein